MVSTFLLTGLREVFVYLAKHRMIDVIVTSAGGIEEDFVKCLAPTLLGDFQLEVCYPVLRLSCEIYQLGKNAFCLCSAF